MFLSKILTRRDHLTDTLTSYDLYKALAVILMVIDHIGHYFYPEVQELRIFGRMSIPIWIGLIGYSNSRDISIPMVLGGCLILFENIALGLNTLPLNILFSFMFIRAFLDQVAKVAFKNFEMMTYVVLMCLFLSIPTDIISEYGTMGLLIALGGYALRHREEMEMNKYLIHGFMLFSVLAFGVYESIMFGFSITNSLLCIAGVLLTSAMMYFFRPVDFPNLTTKLPRSGSAVIRVLGRYTLEIYVAHLMLFKLAYYFLHQDHFILFQPPLIPMPL